MQQPDASKEVKKQSCRQCLYTGVATCAGLSAYFLHLAYEDQPPSKTHQRQPDATTSKSTTIRNANTSKQPTWLRTAAMKLMRQKSAGNRSFHLAFGAAWAVAGVYRLYLN